MSTSTILQVQHPQLAQDSIWLNVLIIVMKIRYFTFFILLTTRHILLKTVKNKISVPAAGLANIGHWTTTKASSFPLTAYLLQILKWMKTVWDLGILQQAFTCFCIPR